MIQKVDDLIVDKNESGKWFVKLKINGSWIDPLEKTFDSEKELMECLRPQLRIKI